MYEALREIVVANPAGGYLRLQAGELIPGFYAWPVVNQQAAINSRMVRRRPEGAESAAVGHWPTVTEERESVEHVIARSRDAHAPDVSRETPLASAIEPLVTEQVVEAPDEENVHMCGECDFRGATAQGLRLHITRKHIS